MMMILEWNLCWNTNTNNQNVKTRTDWYIEWHEGQTNKTEETKKTVEATYEPWHLCEPVQCANLANGTNTEAESPLDIRP